MPSPSPRLRALARALRNVALGLLAVVLLALVVLLVYLRDLDGKVRSALLDGARDLEAQLGRRVSIGEVHVAMGLIPEIELRDLAIGPAEGAQGELAVPVLRIPVAHLAVALGPLVRSGGDVVEITRFHVDGPEVTVVHSAAGLSIDDLRARLAALPRKPPPPPGKQQVALHSLALTGGKLRLHELGADPGGDVTLDQLGLTGHDLTLTAPSRLSLAVAVLAGAPNVTADLNLVPAAAGPGLQLARVAVHGGAIRLGTAARWAGAVAALDDAELDFSVTVDPGATVGIKATIGLRGVRVAGAPTTLSLDADATLDPDADTLAVQSFAMSAGGVTAHGSVNVRGLSAAPTVDALALDASGDATTIRNLLPPRSWPPGLQVQGPITLALRGGGSPDEVHAHVELAAGDVRAVGMDHAGKSTEGQPASVSAAGTLAFTRATGSLKVSDAEAHVGAIVIHGEAEVRGPGTLDALTIEASAPGEALLEMLPPPLRPPAVTLHGPLVVRLEAHGTREDLQGKVAFDGGAAAVRARGFAKPAGVPLGVTIEGRAAGPDGGVTIDRSEVRLGSAAFAVRGTVHRPEQLDLAFEPLAGPGMDLAGMLRLFPEAAERLAAGTTINGLLAASGKVRRAGGTTTVDLATTLREASIHHGLAVVSGAVTTKAHLEASASAARVQADVDLTGAILDVVPVLSKRAGRAAHVAFTLAREGDRVTLSEARVALPGLTIEALSAEQGPERVHVAMGGATLALGPLVDMVPLLQGRLPPPLAGATLRFGLDLDGAPDALGAASLRIPSLDITGGLGHVAGSAQIDGFPPRALRFEVSRGDVDLSGFDSPEGGGDLPFDPPALHLEGKVHLDSVTTGGETARALDADVSFDHGRLAVAALHLGALGGTVVVEKSWLDLSGVPELELHARGEGLDLSRFAGPRAEELRGRATGSVDVHGQGESRAAMARSLRGSASVKVSGLHVRAVFPDPKITVVNPRLAELMKKEAQKHAGEKRTLDLREASADFDLAAGKGTTRTPLLLRSEDFTVRWTGTVGEGTALALDGQLEILPHVIAAASGRKLIPLGPIPLKLRLFDDGGGRKLELLELKETAAAFRGSLLNAIGNGGAPVP